MWSIIIPLALCLLIGFISTDEEGWFFGIFIGIFAFLFIFFGTLISTPSHNEYYTEPLVLQEVNGILLTPQNGNYFFKYDDQIREAPQKDFIISLSDSIYSEIRYRKQIIDHEAIQKWLPGHWTNDTLIYLDSYILYRKINNE